jgi:hypothetical protein
LEAPEIAQNHKKSLTISANNESAKTEMSLINAKNLNSREITGERVGIKFGLRERATGNTRITRIGKQVTQYPLLPNRK